MATLVLPHRPLSVARDVISTPSAYFWSTPILLALALFLLVWEGPGVDRDFQISQNPLVLEDGDVQDGRCRTRRAVFTDCEARLVYNYGGQSYDTRVEVMFVDFHTGDYETDLVISADHPELATISLGLDKLWNRIITLVLLTGLLVSASLAMLFLAARIWRVKRQLLQPAMLAAVPVEITAFDRKRNVLSITYNDKIAEDKTGRSAYTRMKNGQEPLIVSEADGKSVGLAVRHGQTALPVLLDDRLQRLDLSDEERATALAPFAAEDGTPGTFPTLVEAPPKTVSIWRGLWVFVGTLVLLGLGIIGFWIWYVTSSTTAFQPVGMEINNIMPAPLNTWGCQKLQQRFGNERAPFGCVAADHVTWK